MSWVSWNNICTPKHLGGVALLNLEDYMVVRIFNCLKGMCIGTRPWAKIIGHFVEMVCICIPCENANYNLVGMLLIVLMHLNI